MKTREHPCQNSFFTLTVAHCHTLVKNNNCKKSQHFWLFFFFFWVESGGWSNLRWRNCDRVAAIEKIQAHLQHLVLMPRSKQMVGGHQEHGRDTLFALWINKTINHNRYYFAIYSLCLLKLIKTWPKSLLVSSESKSINSQQRLFWIHFLQVKITYHHTCSLYSEQSLMPNSMPTTVSSYVNLTYLLSEQH